VWYYELPRHLGRLGTPLGSRPGGTDGRPLPGGDVMVLMGPGSQGLDDTGETSRADDPVSVAYELACWENDWREVRRDDSAPDGNVWRVAQWLSTHSRWAAASYPRFPSFLKDVRSLHGRLENATGRRRSPTRADAPCFNCGGVLLRQVGDDGLEQQHVTCQACRMQYSPAAYAEALRAATTRVHRDGEVWEAAAQLSSRLGRSMHTLAAWRTSSRVRAHRWAGVLFLNVEDVEREHDLRSVRK
jgi:hypothetical protein